MTIRESLNELLRRMPEERQRDVLRYAQFVNWREEHEQWHQFGLERLARAYGPDEPEYTEADLKADENP